MGVVRGNIWEQTGVIPIYCSSKCETFAATDLQSPANFLAAESAVSWRNPWAVGRLLFCFLGMLGKTVLPFAAPDACGCCSADCERQPRLIQLDFFVAIW